MMHYHRICLLIIIVSLAFARIGWAGDVGSARAHYKNGIAAYTLGDFVKAAAEYEAAYSDEPDPALLYNAAQAHRFAGNKQRAMFLYQNYLRFFPNRSNKAEVQRHIHNLQAAIDTDTAAKSAPPIAPLNPEGRRQATEIPRIDPQEPSEPKSEPAVTKAAGTSVVVVAPRPAKKKAWVWGVVGGSIAVVAVGLGVGLGLGLSGNSFPTADIGSARLK